MVGKHMFRRQWWLFGKTVSDEGFSVSFSSRFTLLYEIDQRSMVIRKEGDGRDIDVFHGSMRHWTDDNSDIDEETDRRNVDNITRALEWRGFSVRIIPDGTGW